MTCSHFWSPPFRVFCSCPVLHVREKCIGLGWSLIPLPRVFMCLTQLAIPLWGSLLCIRPWLTIVHLSPGWDDLWPPLVCYIGTSVQGISRSGPILLLYSSISTRSVMPVSVLLHGTDCIHDNSSDMCSIDFHLQFNLVLVSSWGLILTCCISRGNTGHGQLGRNEKKFPQFSGSEDGRGEDFSRWRQRAEGSWWRSRAEWEMKAGLCAWLDDWRDPESLGGALHHQNTHARTTEGINKQVVMTMT